MLNLIIFTFPKLMGFYDNEYMKEKMYYIIHPFTCFVISLFHYLLYTHLLNSCYLNKLHHLLLLSSSITINSQYPTDNFKSAELILAWANLFSPALWP